MMPAMYSAIGGLDANQQMLNVTADNLSNLNTIGYKAQRADFVSELAQLISSGGAPGGTNAGTNPEQLGLGVQIGSVDNLMSQGSVASTGNALDVSIQGDGFLCVAPGTPGSTPTTGVPAVSTFSYTRAGNLTTNAAGYLTTQSGQYVIGVTAAGASPATAGTYILIPPGSTNVSISQNGAVNYTDSTGTAHVAGYISLATFPNEPGLTRLGNTQWAPSLNSGAPAFGTPANGTMAGTALVAGQLEQSNADMGTEFTNMVTAERAYQANASVIQTVNTMMQTLIQNVG